MINHIIKVGKVYIYIMLKGWSHYIIFYIWAKINFNTKIYLNRLKETSVNWKGYVVVGQLVWWYKIIQVTLYALVSSPKPELKAVDDVMYVGFFYFNSHLYYPYCRNN